MTISAIGGCSPAQTQATQYSSATSASGATGTTAASGASRDGSTFISAIASALSDIGVSAPSTGGASTGATTADPAQALGGFLQTLMQTLQSQNAGAQQGAQGDSAVAGTDATATQGAAPAHAHGHHGGGKGGHMQADLKSLIASLGSTSTDGTASSATAADATSTAATATGATSELAGSFKNLLGALGVDSANSSAKLGQFLQTLSSKLESSGPSGNLVNTTA
jgi:hypothetical protein